MLNKALESGKAAEIFSQMTSLLGGPSDLLENYDKHLAKAPIIRPLLHQGAGYVSHIDTRALGLSVVTLGGGRTHAEDAIDSAVGLENVISIGDSSEQALAIIHARDESSWQEAAECIKQAISFQEAKEPDPPIIYEVIR